MKKIGIILSIVFGVVLGCNSSSPTSESSINEGQEGKSTKDLLAENTTSHVEGNTNKAESSQKKNVGDPVKIGKQGFLDQIMDYEKNKTEWVYKGELPSLVDFYADWCRPCRMTSPILDELAEEYKGQIIIYKVDIDEEKELAAVFGVRSIPTFLFIPMNSDPQLSAGIASTPAETKALFKQQIEEILLKNK